MADIEREVELLWLALHEERQVVAMKNQLIAALQQTLRSSQTALDELTMKHAAVGDRCASLEAENATLRLDGRASESTASAPSSESEDEDAATKSKAKHAAMFATHTRIENDRLRAQLASISFEWSRLNGRNVENMFRSEEFCRSTIMETQLTSHASLLNAKKMCFHIAQPRYPLHIDHFPLLHAVSEKSKWCVDEAFNAGKRQLAMAFQSRNVADSGAAVAVSNYFATMTWAHWCTSNDMWTMSRKSVNTATHIDLQTKFIAWIQDHMNLRDAKVKRVVALFTELVPQRPGQSVIDYPPDIGAHQQAEARIWEMGHRIRALEERAAAKTKTISELTEHIRALQHENKQFRAPRAVPPAQAQSSSEAGLLLGADLDARVVTPQLSSESKQSEPTLVQFTTFMEGAKRLLNETLLQCHAAVIRGMSEPKSSEPLAAVVKRALARPPPEPADPSTASDVEVRLLGAARVWTAYSASVMIHTHDEYGKGLSERLADIAGAFFQVVPTSKSADAVRADIAERSLSLVEAQRDQAATVANWMHTEATTAVRTLSGLVSRVDRAVSSRPREVTHRDLSAADEIDHQHKMRELERHTQRSVAQFGNICDALLDHAAQVQAKLIESEHDIAVLKRSAAEHGSKGTEYQTAASKYAVSHRLERDVSDDAIQLLHTHLSEERTAALRSMKILGIGIARRNTAILGLHEHIRTLSIESRGALMMAEKLWEAFTMITEMHFTSIKQSLRNERVRHLPSAAEIQHLLLVVHSEMGTSLEAAAAEGREHAVHIHKTLEDLDALKRRHQTEMMEAGQEIVRLTRARRLEQESTELFSTLCTTVAEDAVMRSRQIAQESLWCHVDAVSTLFRERNDAHLTAETHRARREAAEARLQVLEIEGKDEKLRADTAQAQVISLSESMQKLTGEISRTAQEAETLQNRVLTAEQKVIEMATERSTLVALLAAEKQAYSLAQSHEAALEREVVEAAARADRAQNRLSTIDAELAREKEAHRATIRSISQR
jgi:hypothetical protein